MPPRKKVLLVDDSTDLLEVYEIVLSVAGYETRTAASVDEAIETIRGWRPDVVVTDIVMPEKSGFDLITWMRSDLPPPLPGIVALSGFPDVEDEALRRGATTFRIKPLEATDLLDLLASVLDTRTPRPAPEGESRGLGRRAAAIEAAEAAVSEAMAQHPDLMERVRVWIRYLSTYFSHGAAAVLLFSKGHLRVLCSSNPDLLPDGAPADYILGPAADVIASGSSLVIPSTGMGSMLKPNEQQEARPLVSVPLISEQRDPLGNLAVFGDLARPFDAVDLRILEHVARHAAVVFLQPNRHPLAWAPYILRDEHWRFLLQQELAHVGEGWSIAVSMVETEEELPSEKAISVGEALSARMALAWLGPRRSGIFKLADSVEAARNAVGETVQRLDSAVRVQHAATVILSEMESPREVSTLLDIVDANLRSALREREHTIATAVLHRDVETIGGFRSSAR